MGLEKPRGGEVLLGEHNVLPNYFEQNQVGCFHNAIPFQFKPIISFDLNFTFRAKQISISDLSVIDFFIQAEALDLDKTVLETVAEAAEDWRIDDIKGLLGRCNFKADMLDRKVSLLSGGEKVKQTLV